MTVKYSQRSDVLYIVFETSSSPCIYIEMGSGVVCRINESTNRVVGITVRDFNRQIKDGKEFDIPELNFGIPANQLLQFASEE